VSSKGYNLSSDTACDFDATGDMNNIDPKLGPLQNNGGPTQTEALLAGSPAIDAGNPSGCTDGKGHLLDQRQINLLLPQWVIPQHTGTWTVDGRYFFFDTHDPIKDRDEDVWAMAESGRSRTAPVRLTEGPLAFGYPFPSADGKRVFVIGSQSRAELTRYDSHTRQFQPYLAGLSAWEAEISRDGNWVAYVSYPDLTLWRSRLDGTKRVQLTFPPIEVRNPRWSPDGTRIAFTDLQPGKLWKIYIISAQGGTVQEILSTDTEAEFDPSWLPDGKSIIFGRSYFTSKGGIERVDLGSHEVTRVPGSEKLFSPRVSPDGSKIAAFLEQGTSLMLYDFHEQEWRDAAHGVFQFNIWSRDGKSIFMLDMRKNPKIVRFDLDRGRFSHVVDLQGVEQGSRGWVGLAPDDSPLIVRDKSVSDVYRLDLQIP